MNIAIVVAGGKGKRMRKRINKLFLLLNKEPIIFHTMRKFQDCKNVNNIVLVVNPEDKKASETIEAEEAQRMMKKMKKKLKVL